MGVDFSAVRAEYFLRRALADLNDALAEVFELLLWRQLGDVHGLRFLATRQHAAFADVGILAMDLGADFSLLFRCSIA